MSRAIFLVCVTHNNALGVVVFLGDQTPNTEACGLRALPPHPTLNFLSRCSITYILGGGQEEVVKEVRMSFWEAGFKELIKLRYFVGSRGRGRSCHVTNPASSAPAPYPIPLPTMTHPISLTPTSYACFFQPIMESVYIESRKQRSRGLGSSDT